MVKIVTHERQEVLSFSRAWNHMRLIVQGCLHVWKVLELRTFFASISTVPAVA